MEPLPKISNDPAQRLALARDFLAMLGVAKTDDDVTKWLKANTPRLGDALAIAILAVAECPATVSRFDISNPVSFQGAPQVADDFRKRAFGHRSVTPRSSYGCESALAP